MTLGPIEIVVLGFPGSKFTGEIRPKIEDLVHRGIVRIVDAVFIRKADDGSVRLLELQEISDDPELAELTAALSQQLDLVSGDDVDSFARDLAPGSSALVLAFEHTWLKPVRDAMVAAGGVLLTDLHVPAGTVEEVLASVPT